MHVRAARPEDLDELLDLYEAVAEEGIHIGGEAPVDRPRRKAAWLELMDPEAPGTSLGAEAAGAILGQVGISGSGRMEIGMWVRKDRRGEGIGTALLKAALDHARAHDAYKISLEVWPHNTAAIALYERFGFRREGYLRKHWRRRNGELWDSVVMGLVLDE